MTKWLASVQSVDEARTVLPILPDILDMKNPSLGALGALSVDHLEEMAEEDYEALKGSNCMPTILPSCSFFLRIPYGPAKRMIEEGLPVALATDYNPGSTPSGNMNFVASLGCIQMKMTPEQVINATTINTAYAMGVEKELGSVCVGKKANLFITKVIPSYALPEQGVKFNFKPAMFTQVNYEINKKMITRVIETLDLNENDNVLDLFCGLGNFTLPMATKAGHVVGVEGDQPLVNHAKENAKLNGLENVEFHVADLSKDVSAQAWARQKFNKVLLDPSRAGASEVLHNLKHWNPEQIMYVSCNPSTLARDAGILVNEMGYTLVKAGVMDMFPQTGHVESIALFEKK